MTITIRNFEEKRDAQPVGVLIAETYRKYNLSFASPEEQEKLLGPFRRAWSIEPYKCETIRLVLRTDMIFVAEDNGQIVGMLRCRPGRLQSLFVRADHHRLRIGLRLMERCERECSRLGTKVIRLEATLHAVPFYEAIGYKKSTGIRNCLNSDGRGLKYQPMKKELEGSI